MPVPRLELFVHGSTRAGREARAHVERLSAALGGDNLQVALIDLELQPEAGKALDVRLTPTLVRRDLPGAPRVFGSLADLAASARALALAEVAP
ncbi:MAG: hypothetical protein FJ294_01640 [Planctomycetes bacterium]|nr:hypothetical protein [Planctomycetota bacterium]